MVKWLWLEKPRSRPSAVRSSVLRQQIERTRQPQALLIAIERHALNLLKDLRQVDGRVADFGAERRERPPPGQIGRERDLRAVDDPAQTGRRAWHVRRARSERPAEERQRARFVVERCVRMVPQTMTERRGQRLRPWIDAQPLPLKRDGRPIVEQRARHQLREQRLAHDQVETGVSTRLRVVDAIALTAVEEQHLVGVGHRLVASETPDENAPIGKNDVRRRGVLVGGGLPAGAGAPHVANGDRCRFQERMGFDVGHRVSLPAAGLRGCSRSAYRRSASVQFTMTAIGFTLLPSGGLLITNRSPSAVTS